MAQIIDSHAHLTMDEILPHVESILRRAQEARIEKIINICTDEESLESGLVLKRRHLWIENAGATTPHDVEKEGEKMFAVFEKAARNHDLIAIGETGLDYHYLHSNKKVQQQFFSRYLHLAKECHLPVIVHCREAFSDLFAIMDGEYPRGLSAILHCFTGDKLDAEKALDRGYMISLSGILTYRNAEPLREVVKNLPLESLLVETDTPFLAPQSHRGKPNEPALIWETISTLAELHHRSVDDVAEIVTQNTKRTFFKKDGIL